MNDEILKHLSCIFHMLTKFSDHYDNQWRERSRKIDTKFMIIFLIKIIFSKGDIGYSSVLAEIWNDFETSELKTPQAKPFSASSICEARQKFAPEIIQEINSLITSEYFELNNDNYRWNGRRIFAVDGSTIYLPHELIKEGYKTIQEENYDPAGKLSFLYHIGSSLVTHTVLDRKGDEREIAKQHMQYLLPEDVVIFDRGYFSYEFCLYILSFGVDFVIRFSAGQGTKEMLDFINDKDLINDKIITIFPSSNIKSKLSKNLKSSQIQVRLIRYKIDNKYYFIVTSLLDNSISPDEFSILYHDRWEIEGAPQAQRITEMRKGVDKTNQLFVAQAA